MYLFIHATDVEDWWVLESVRDRDTQPIPPPQGLSGKMDTEGRF